MLFGGLRQGLLVLEVSLPLYLVGRDDLGKHRGLTHLYALARLRM